MSYLYRCFPPFWDGKVLLETLPVFSLKPVHLTELGRVTRITGWAFVAGQKPVRVRTEKFFVSFLFFLSIWKWSITLKPEKQNCCCLFVCCCCCCCCCCCNRILRCVSRYNYWRVHPCKQALYQGQPICTKNLSNLYQLLQGSQT